MFFFLFHGNADAERDFGLVSPQKEVAYGDFLKRQGGAKLEVLRYYGNLSTRRKVPSG